LTQARVQNIQFVYRGFENFDPGYDQTCPKCKVVTQSCRLYYESSGVSWMQNFGQETFIPVIFILSAIFYRFGGILAIDGDESLFFHFYSC